MKKILSITISLFLVFVSVLPVYAEAWTSQQASNVTSDVNDIQQDINNLKDYFYDFWATANGENASTFYSWQDFMYEFWRLSEFLIPRGSYQGQTNLWQIVEGTLPNILTYVSSWMQTNNSILNSSMNYLEQLEMANTHHFFSFTEAWDYNDIVENANYWLFNEHSDLTGTKRIGDFRVPYVYPNGTTGNGNLFWQDGTPLGTIALMLRTAMDNQVNSHYSVWNAALTDYTGQLGIWDSQGETLTQEGWSPTSAINGLYKYLAYTQRDVARLTYVLASDEEIETREKARETQTAVMDDFIDPDGGAAASTENFGEIASGSANVQQNFSTGYSVSNMWGAFGSEHYGWFSQECADALDTSSVSTSGNRLLKNDKHNEPDYDTPLLDEYYKQILSLGGGNDD